MFDIKIARFPLRMRNETLILRLYRFQDLPALFDLFTPELFLKMNGITVKAFRSVFAFYGWLRTTFQMVYIIEARRTANPQIVGFVGFYNIEVSQSLGLSLAIFHLEDRQRGYGQQALELLLQCLQKDGVVKTVHMEVLRTNFPSLRLCKRLGFVVRRHTESIAILERRLSSQK